MILIAQQSNGLMYASLVARPTRAGAPVLITGSRAEAFDLIHEARPNLVILDRPDTAACPDLLCGWIRKAINPAPRLLGLTDPEDPAQRERCQRCVTLLHPDTHPPWSPPAPWSSWAGPSSHQPGPTDESVAQHRRIPYSFSCATKRIPPLINTASVSTWRWITQPAGGDP